VARRCGARGSTLVFGGSQQLCTLARNPMKAATKVAKTSRTDAEEQLNRFIDSSNAGTKP
jgi:hypothetical protein